MTLTTDPALLELVGTLDQIKARIAAIDPDSASIRWISELDALGVALTGTIGSLAKLKTLILADALAEGIEGMDPDAAEGSAAHTRALLYALAEATDFVSLFSGWPAEFSALSGTIQGDATAAQASAAAARFVGKLDTYLQAPQLRALVGNPWGVELVEPVQAAVSALKGKLS